jgi:hypothetical protein
MDPQKPLEVTGPSWQAETSIGDVDRFAYNTHTYVYIYIYRDE